MKKLLTIVFILLLCNLVKSQELKTQALSDDIYTIQVNLGGEWDKQPIIELNSAEVIQISFDRLGSNSSNELYYRIINCNADWTPSSLNPIEYLDGFNDILIDDYAQSVNTTVDYMNFRIDIPNDRFKLKLSGNYVVEVYEPDNPSVVLLRAAFSVLDPEIQINGTLSTVTDIDANKEHQQISFTINYNNLPVRDVFSDLKVFVFQNNRLDNQKKLIKPTYIQGEKLIYEHNRNLIFEAGNEYRRFETVGTHYNGLNIEKTVFSRPFYYANILVDKMRSDKKYSYDQDQNGRFLIRNSEVSDSNTEADYMMTNFRLSVSEPLSEPIYLNGGFTNNTFDDKYLMDYDYENKEYTASLLLKQGAYNYQYLAESDNIYTTSLLEGNYFEARNEYKIMVYFRPLGRSYDLLVGVLLIENK